MKLSEIIQKPVSFIAENGILNDVVEKNETAKSVIEKITKNLEDVLVVYIDSENRIEGIITKYNLRSVLDDIRSKDKSLVEIPVSDLKWDKTKNFHVRNTDSIATILKKFADGVSDIFVVTDSDGVYTGKIKRANALNRVQELAD